MNQLLLGAIAMASLTVGLFFVKFWRKTRDRFFLFFATAFGLEAINRALLGSYQESSEHEPVFYLIRLISFLLILAAVVDKNRGWGAGPGADGKAERG
jgi:hypothetical protein